MTFGPGQRLGAYRIVGQLGAGEMGVVYEAHDERLGRDVAIKVLAAQVASDEDMVARFEREVRAIAALSHPNVLAIYDIGKDGDAIFAVMELVRGVTLRDRLAGGLLARTQVIDLAAQIARGLDAAHGKGIVHRDLKPENLLVTPDGLVKILDFGLAKFDPLGLGGTDRATLFSTVPGMVLGTLAYMAPEQVRGVLVDHRADLFALGAILFEMLHGEPPFVRAGSADTIAALVSPDGPDPAALAGMPEGLARLVEQCLAKSVADRPESAAAILAELNALRGATIAGAQTQVMATRAQGADVRRGRSIAVLPFADMSAARDQAYFCEGMADEIISTLGRVRGLQVVARTSAFRFKGDDQDVREIGRTLGVEAVLEGSVRTSGRKMRVTAQLVSAVDGYQLWTERFDRDAEDVFAIQDEIAKAVRQLLTASLAEQSRTLVPASRPSSLDAYTLYLKGRHHWSRRTATGLERSLDCFNQALDVDPGYGPAWAGLADGYLMLGLYGIRPPAEVMPLAGEAASKALAADSDLAGAHATLGCVAALSDWRWDQALASFDRAIAIDPSHASAYQWRAMHLHMPFARFTDATHDLASAVTLDPVSPAIGASQALLAHFAGDSRRALDLIGHVVDLDPATPLPHFFRSLVLADSGDGPAAGEAISRALDLGGRTPELVAAQGLALAVSRDRTGARAVLSELAATSAERYVSPVAVSQIHVALADHDAAISALEQGLKMRSPDLIWVATRPAFAPLAGQPRFDALLDRVGLPRRS